ncbi:substrate-binding periplasmic protein [Gilvimarinus agarilyticus]|uniref:substrate-binding periplasmic protein n=1 Tax=Gilvimarinus agarilyticus TaxID=679259 RepID=UPI0005A0DF9E|nr:transporter substrate-binding domain-containing protein [Gilvimarinus agarilyticus]
MNNNDFFQVVKHLLGFILSAFLVLIAPHAQADSEPRAAIKIVTIAAPPWASATPSTGEMNGAFIDIVKALTERTGYQFDITLAPFARAAREIERGTQDCTILAPLDTDKVVAGELTFHHPLGAIPNKSVSLKEYEDLAGQRISVLRGGSLNERFDNDNDLEKVFDTDYATGLRKVARHRVDVVVGAIPTLMYIARLEGITDSLGPPLVMQTIPLIFQCSKASERLNAMPAINQALIDMRTEGALVTIQKQHEL